MKNAGIGVGRTALQGQRGREISTSDEDESREPERHWEMWVCCFPLNTRFGVPLIFANLLLYSPPAWLLCMWTARQRESRKSGVPQ